MILTVFETLFETVLNEKVNVIVSGDLNTNMYKADSGLSDLDVCGLKMLLPRLYATRTQIILHYSIWLSLLPQRR